MLSSAFSAELSPWDARPSKPEGGNCRPGGKAVPPVIEGLKSKLAQGAMRAVYLIDVAEAAGGNGFRRIRTKYPGFTHTDMALLKSIDDKKVVRFSLDRLLVLSDAAGCEARIDVILPEPEARAPDELTRLLFKSLSAADKACQAALADIGSRSYPLTRLAVRHAGTQCALAVDAIRAAPEFWHREASLFSAALFSAESMLRQMAAQPRTIQKAIAALKETAELLEEVADTKSGDGTRMPGDCG